MKREVIIFSGALYDSPLWTNRQHIALRLAERGWRVLYVEPRLFLPRMLLGKFIGTEGRLKWFRRIWMPWKVNKNLTVAAQFNLIPKSREHAWISTFNHFINKWLVKLHSYLLGFDNPSVLIYDTEAAQYLDDFSNSNIVYDCVDDHRAQAGVNRNPRRVEQEELELGKKADAISVTTEPLKERFEKINRNVVLNPNAADVYRFINFVGDEPVDISGIPHPRIGTVGALDDYKINAEIINFAAKNNPDWHFILVGPVDFIGSHDQESGIGALKKFKNVHFLGQKKYEQVPAYVHSMDVSVIPYRKSAYNNASFPLKFWEFIASGKPVVVSGLPALVSYAGLIEFAENGEEFEKAIERSLKISEAQRDELITEAKKHDWRKRVDVIEGILG